ncbi:hypothetical protein UPYG_G00063080 [Umbra pygmaea]|uniref:Uncharacterized protein n=1 Tax=Umbra pygmaea TaxID=75934 RepID=A0ABD0XAC8_UMBPY
MVELMKFTRGICRLLGIGGDGPGEQLDMDCAGGSGGDPAPGIGEAQPAEEGLSEERKVRRRAERRRAKRKQQKERKKREKEKDTRLQERGGSGSESESEKEEVEKEEVESDVPVPRNKRSSPLAASGDNGNHPAHLRTPEEEPEWDVSSAFVANAASHIRPKARSRTGHASRENKENEARTSEVESSESDKIEGASLTEKGIALFKQGLYSEAVDMFSEAIRCDPNDHRFFGNRSYCYWCLELYSSALADAEKSIQLAPDWPKGYFRKGSALMGLKRYAEAEKDMLQVLTLDQNCEVASTELLNCKVLQLMDLGFEEVQSVQLLEKFGTVQAAAVSSQPAKVVDFSSPQDSSGAPCPSLWVGNITTDLTEERLWELFETCGEIESIRVLHERFCAFVNFKNANMAARALERLQGVELETTRLVIRYPDRWVQRTPSLPQRSNVTTVNNTSGSQNTCTGPSRMAPVNGDECFFWRTTGCMYGDKCRFKHKHDQRGRDRKPWQP